MTTKLSKSFIILHLMTSYMLFLLMVFITLMVIGTLETPGQASQRLVHSWRITRGMRCQSGSQPDLSIAIVWGPPRVSSCGRQAGKCHWVGFDCFDCSICWPSSSREGDLPSVSFLLSQIWKNWHWQRMGDIANARFHPSSFLHYDLPDNSSWWSGVSFGGWVHFGFIAVEGYTGVAGTV